MSLSDEIAEVKKIQNDHVVDAEHKFTQIENDLDAMKQRVDGLLKAYYGDNGSDGVKILVDRLAQDHQRRSFQYRAIWAALATAVTAGVVGWIMR